MEIEDCGGGARTVFKRVDSYSSVRRELLYHASLHV